MRAKQENFELTGLLPFVPFRSPLFDVSLFRSRHVCGRLLSDQWRLGVPRVPAAGVLQAGRNSTFATTLATPAVPLHSMKTTPSLASQLSTFKASTSYPLFDHRTEPDGSPIGNHLFQLTSPFKSTTIQQSVAV